MEGVDRNPYLRERSLDQPWVIRIKKGANSNDLLHEHASFFKAAVKAITTILVASTSLESYAMYSDFKDDDIARNMNKIKFMLKNCTYQQSVAKFRVRYSKFPISKIDITRGKFRQEEGTWGNS